MTDARITCFGCGIALAATDAFEPEYTNCRSYCCGCCPDSKQRVCQKDKLDKKNGRPVGLVETLAKYD